MTGDRGVNPLGGRSLLDAEDFARAIAAGTEWLGANKELVNALNVFPVPMEIQAQTCT